MGSENRKLNRFSPLVLKAHTRLFLPTLVLFHNSLPGQRTKTGIPRGTGWKRFARRRRIFFLVFPRDGMGIVFRLFSPGWEWDGKVGSRLVNGTGRNRGTGREYSREIGREHSRDIGEYGRETLSGMVGSAPLFSSETSRHSPPTATKLASEDCQWSIRSPSFVVIRAL